MKIEEYLSTLPQSILSGEEIQIPPDTIREIFRFTDLGKNDIFYHLGCGDGVSLSIAREEFDVKNAIGIDNSEKMITAAKKMIGEKNISNIKVIEQDVRKAEFNDADVILCWFMDPEILEKMMEKFKKLKNVKYYKDIQSACFNSDLIVLHTEWNDFRLLNFKKLVKKSNFKIFDMRNMYSPSKMKNLKIKYFGIGR